VDFVWCSFCCNLVHEDCHRKKKELPYGICTDIVFAKI
jgi:hypothetical protein